MPRVTRLRPTPSSPIAKLIREMRLLRQWDQETLAKLAHVSVGTIRNYERGTVGKERRPLQYGPEMLRALACGFASNPETGEVDKELEMQHFGDLLRAAGYLPDRQTPPEVVQRFVERILPHDRARFAAMDLERSGFFRSVEGVDRLADLLEEAARDYRRKLREDDR